VVGRHPAAFMSYVRFDDQHEGGQLTQFRERLSAEVHLQTGEEFPIFQDRNDIAWGQNWEARINETLDAVTLLIPIITPSFFRSPPCRDEVTRFLEREHELGRNDLILPVYYVSASELDDPKLRAADPVVQVLAARQYADWRDLRYEPFTAPLVRRALAQLASRLRDSFWRTLPARPPSPSPVRRVAAETASAEITPAEPATGEAPRSAAKQEPPTHVVDAHGRGHHTTIGAAITAAGPGDRILVRPGLYQERLVLDKPLELLGDGSVEDIEVQADSASVLLFQANMGRVANLTLRQTGGEGEWFGVDITQGRLELEGCLISSQNLACVAIRNGADPRLRRNRIHGGKRTGVLVYDSGLGTLEDNDISGNTLSGVQIKTGGNPTLRRNQIHDNKASGVFVYENGLGTLEDNDVASNDMSGVLITENGNPTLRRNRINRNQDAVSVHHDGRGVFEDNDLTANGQGPWNIAKDCQKNVKRTGNRV
jgi:parallel beta-helix repeat protein